MLASPAPQAAHFDAVAATLSHSLRFQLFQTSNLTNKSTTNAPIKRTGAHTSDAALTLVCKQVNIRLFFRRVVVRRGGALDAAGLLVWRQNVTT